jgi:hypothetical protein
MWNHLCVTFDESARQCVLYINAKYASAIQVQGPLLASHYDLCFGLQLNNSSLNCRLSDIRIFSDCLPDEVISDQMYFPPDVSKGSLLGWWLLDQSYVSRIHLLADV